MSDGQTNVLMDKQTDIFNKADKVMGQTDRVSDIQTDGMRDRRRERLTELQTDRVSDRRRERQTNEVIDRQTERVKDIWTEI